MKALGAPADPQERLAEAVLAAVPNFADRPVRYAPAVPGAASPSYHGVESSTYDVAADDGEAAFFLKVTTREIRHHVDHAAAFDAARKMAALGAAPEPLHLAAAEGAILFRRLGDGWRAARIDDLREPDRLARLISLHKTVAAGPAFLHDWTVFDGIRGLRDALADGPATPLPGDAWWLFEAVAPIEEAVRAVGFDRLPAQADPHATNIMIGPDGALRLVDFDLAANVDPYYQLGALLNEVFQFESEMRQAVETFDGVFRQASFNRCRLYAAADDLYWGLRALLLERLSPRLGLEFRKYAEWRFLRCRMLVNRPGFEELLRSI